MKIRRRYKNNSKINILLPLIFLFVVFLSVGYSSLNQELNITSEAVFRVEESIRITDVKLVGSTFIASENYNSSYSKDRIKTGITLNDANASITYQVTITNAGNVPMNLSFLENINYNNDGITYELNEKLPFMINKGEEKKIELTYKWSSYNEKNKNLDAVIKFNFIKAESVLANGSSSSFINNSSIDRSKVESIKFMPTIEVPSSAVEVWDASLNKDGSVMAYTLDNDSNDLYELYIAGYGEIKLSEAYYLFQNFNSMVTLDFDNLVTTDNVTNMQGMFIGCSSLANIDVGNFNTSNVTNMSEMFEYCQKLTSVDLSKFDTSKTTVMTSMFYYCTSLEGMLDLSHFDVSKVTNMWGMFYNCSKLTSLKLNNWKAYKVTNMSDIFTDCSSVTELEMNNFSVLALTSLRGIFSPMTKVESISVKNWDIPKVTNVSAMFKGLNAMTTLNIEEFNAPSMVDMSNMFNGCSKLETIDVSSFKTDNVTNMNGVFNGCSSLTNIDVSNFNTSNVTNMSEMFEYCQKLASVDLSNFDTRKVTAMTSMFYYCTSLEGTLDLSSFDISSVKIMWGMFYNCSKLISLKLNNWNPLVLTNVGDIFTYCSQLKEIDFSLVNSETYEKDIFKSMLGKIGDITFYVKDSECKTLLEAIKPNAIIEIKSA